MIQVGLSHNFTHTVGLFIVVVFLPTYDRYKSKLFPLHFCPLISQHRWGVTSKYF